MVEVVVVVVVVIVLDEKTTNMNTQRLHAILEN